MFPIEHFLYLGAVLFSAGLVVIITKKNMIMVLLGVELMLNASNLNLVAFNQLYPENISGQMFALFVIIVAVCEAAVGLAIVIQVYHRYHTSVPSEVDELSD
jgi:NADH:ubiquinone oxidoreductase subunit K